MRAADEPSAAQPQPKAGRTTKYTKRRQEGATDETRIFTDKTSIDLIRAIRVIHGSIIWKFARAAKKWNVCITDDADGRRAEGSKESKEFIDVGDMWASEAHSWPALKKTLFGELPRNAKQLWVENPRLPAGAANAAEGQAGLFGIGKAVTMTWAD